MRDASLLILKPPVYLKLNQSQRGIIEKQLITTKPSNIAILQKQSTKSHILVPPLHPTSSIHQTLNYYTVRNFK